MAKRTITPEPRSAQEKFQSTRQLKVRKGYYEHQYRHTSLQRHKVPEAVPWVQIKGYWLNQAGFSIGKNIKVRVRPGCLVLKVF